MYIHILILLCSLKSCEKVMWILFGIQVTVIQILSIIT